MSIKESLEELKSALSNAEDDLAHSFRYDEDIVDPMFDEDDLELIDEKYNNITSNISDLIDYIDKLL